MDLLISPSLVFQYINNLSKISKTYEEKLLALLFENKNNSFIVNQKLLDFFESEFDPNSYEYIIYQDELVGILGNNMINIITTKDTILEVLADTHVEYINQKNSLDAYVNLCLDGTYSLKNNFSGVLNNVANVLSKDYIYFFLAAYNPIGLTKWFYDFRTNNEVKTFLENLYKLRTHNEIIIFDRNINLTHNYYDFLKNKRLSFKYYTLMHHTFNVVERSNQYRAIKGFFDNCGLTVFRAPLTVIHERRIMFNNIIIDFDNDLANLKIEEPNWKINIYVCNEIKRMMDNKRINMFNRDNIT